MTSPFYNPAPVFIDNQGRPVAGGFLYFYEKGSTTPKLTWSDEAMTIPNPNPVPLDSSGRANNNIWIKGSYTVWLRDNLGAALWNRDINDGSVGNNVFPTLEAGKFLTNDGSVVLWADLIQLPDPTGSDGKMVVASGGGYVLQAQPTAPVSPIVVTDTSVKYVGTSSVILEQWGTASIPASGAQIATGTITFPTAYTTVPNLQVTINKGSGVVAAGFIGDIGVPSVSTTGATVAWDLGVDDVKSMYNLTSPLPIMWRAIGKVAS